MIGYSFEDDPEVGAEFGSYLMDNAPLEDFDGPSLDELENG